MRRSGSWCVVLAALAGCSGSEKTYSDGTSGTDWAGTSWTYPSVTGSDGTSDTESGGETTTATGEATGEPAAGTLTAGAWDDNENYPWFLDYVADAGEPPGAPRLSAEEQAAASALFAGDRAPRARLDVAVLLDTTASMGDELAWLQAEVGGLAERLAAEHPQAEIRWAFVAYRDDAASFVTRTYDFTSDVGLFEERVASETAGGGGDFPEAVDAGLGELLGLGWRPDADVARVAFWIGDAPGHPGTEGAITEALRDAAARDIHLYPVGASGMNATAELTMREAAQLTGGRYLFLTDDSGVGGSHLEPAIPCFYVTLLSDAVARTVDIELAGAWHAPDPAEILRTTGDPLDGVCALADGTTARAF